MSELVASRLAVGHAERSVLEGLDLALSPGQLVGIVGPNGAGKSTLLETLAGLHPLRAGQITLAGKPLEAWGLAGLARQRAFMPQQLPAMEGWGVREVVRMGRFAHQRGWGLVERPADRTAIDAAMELAGVQELAERPVAQLSGGQRQRVYLARALAQEAPVLLLDEPIAHLDPAHQIAFFRVLHAAMAARPLAAAVVLHDLNLAAQFCHRLWVVGAGRLLADGPPGQVLDPALVERAFGLAVQVRYHPESGLPYLLPATQARGQGAGPALHVIAGGGAGERLLPLLHARGYRLSVGALNLLDSDQALAEGLGLPVVLEAPFSPLSPATLAALTDQLRAATAVVVADVAWGSGNLGNLRALAELPELPETWLVADTPIAERDFADGEASLLWERLVARGARVVSSAMLLERFGG